MRLSARLLNLSREGTPLQGPKSIYLCSTCRQEVRVHPRPFLIHHQIRHKGTFTERMRRKIWGTDNPPGLQDPYGGEGVIEREVRKRWKPESELEKEEERPEQRTEVHEEVEAYEDDLAPPDEYVQATTWDGLERIGHLGKWSDYLPRKEDAYTPFMPRKKFTKMRHISLAAHQAVVEIAIMHALKKPLVNVCSVVTHHKTVFKFIADCKVRPTENGQWDEAIVFPSKKAKKALLYVFEQIGDTTSRAAIEIRDKTTAPDAFFFGIREVRDSGFLSLPLNDPATKFAFLKRLSQLTGYFFPDGPAHSFTSVKQSVEFIDKQINPKQKLAVELTKNSSLQQLSNVKIFAKRQTQSTRDEELGRKKVIEAVFRERGLIV